ncbi:MAG: c-type cytochrome [Candidatus Marinarcus sp.]|uniref:c-type cytochrome n=1 Tax=Candidatus Marinarcus sp. TaxID=3100987 RepID=UPI003B005BE3
MKKIVLGTLIAAATMMAAANYNKCATCHGAKAEKKALTKSQIIQGWPAEKIEAALHGYKDGTYGGPTKGVMKLQVDALSDADIKDLAKQISAMK